MKSGDLVKTGKSNSIGIVVDIFGDLNPADPWVRVLFTHPVHTYRWCKRSSLSVVKKQAANDVVADQEPRSTSGSL